MTLACIKCNRENTYRSVFQFCFSRLMMSLNQLQLPMQTKLSLAFQHLPLVTQVLISATWHTMVHLLDG